jgi:hypothetical protein
VDDPTEHVPAMNRAIATRLVSSRELLVNPLMCLTSWRWSVRELPFLPLRPEPLGAG